MAPFTFSYKNKTRSEICYTSVDFFSFFDFKIFWKGVKGYDLRFHDSQNVSIEKPSKEDDHFIWRFNNLFPGTKYEFSIAARTSKGLGKVLELPKAQITSPEGQYSFL